MRTHKLNRWNWSDRAKKWVYVEEKQGKRTYKYSIKPPKEFDKLSQELKKLNDKLNSEENYEERDKIFKRMMEISKQMQHMRET